MEGKLKAMDASACEGSDLNESPSPVVLVEKGLEYLSGEVTACDVEEK